MDGLKGKFSANDKGKEDRVENSWEADEESIKELLNGSDLKSSSSSGTLSSSSSFSTLSSPATSPALPPLKKKRMRLLPPRSEPVPVPLPYYICKLTEEEINEDWNIIKESLITRKSSMANGKDKL